MNIEEAIDILVPKENIDLSNHFNNTRFFEAIYTLLTAYEHKCNYIKENEIYKKNLFNNYEEKCKELEKEKEKNKEYKNLLIDMVNQFAYEDNNPGSSEQKIYTAGLSVLEDVFDLLDIDEGIKRENLWKLKEE